MSRSSMSLPISSLTLASTTSPRDGTDARWRPGAGSGCHSEIFTASCEGGGVGAALALALDDWRSGTKPDEIAKDPRAVLWVQTREAARMGGRPYRPGLPAELRHRLIHVVAPRPEDALFSLEEGLRCREIAFVLGELAGNPRALDFTASRRLTLTAERYGVPLYLVRLDARRDLSSARMRWEVTSAPSALPQWNREAPGAPAWHCELFRSRRHAPGQWVLHDQGNALVAAHEEEPSMEPRPRAVLSGN